jgi:hypothetical protein
MLYHFLEWELNVDPVTLLSLVHTPHTFYHRTSNDDIDNSSFVQSIPHVHSTIGPAMTVQLEYKYMTMDHRLLIFPLSILDVFIFLTLSICVIHNIILIILGFLLCLPLPLLR